MANVTFYRGTSTSIPSTDGAISFCIPQGGIYIGNGSTAYEAATRTNFSDRTTSGQYVGTLTINNIQYGMYAQSVKGWANGNSGETLATIISNYSPSIITCYAASWNCTKVTGGADTRNSGVYGTHQFTFMRRAGGGEWFADVFFPEVGVYGRYSLSSTGSSVTGVFNVWSGTAFVKCSVTSGTTQAATLLTNLNSCSIKYSKF